VTALECQVILATIAMENKGLFFNKAIWQHAIHEIEEKTLKIKEKLNTFFTQNDGFLLFGAQPIDLHNHTAVKKALEQLLGQKISGTSQSSLKDIDHDAARLLLYYRENTRMLCTYGEGFLSKVSHDRIRGNFTPIGSASGRFTCHEPNLLALPNHPIFQTCFLPKPPYKLLRFDYGAFELRILASLSKDPALLTIFNDNRDLHSMVAQAVFNTQVSKTENAHLRDQAKLLNFGIIYGMGEHALAKQLKISVHQANNLLRSYFKRFSKVREFLESLQAHARNNGYITTALGRRAYLPPESTNNRGHLERVARNLPIQGTGADIVKLAMCKVFKYLRYHRVNAHIVNVVHDEIVIECNEENLDLVGTSVRKEMEHAFNAILPEVSADISVKG
jgi:DNA polymerase-1